jgi:hypothetical protein
VADPHRCGVPRSAPRIERIDGADHIVVLAGVPDDEQAKIAGGNTALTGETDGHCSKSLLRLDELGR